MKYIKTFDYAKQQTYWKIRTDSPYLETSLYKLNLPDKQIKYILTNDIITNGLYGDKILKYIYIFLMQI
jgi:hypothetical protein